MLECNSVRVLKFCLRIHKIDLNLLKLFAIAEVDAFDIVLDVFSERAPVISQRVLFSPPVIFRHQNAILNLG